MKLKKQTDVQEVYKKLNSLPYPPPKSRQFKLSFTPTSFLDVAFLTPYIAPWKMKVYFSMGGRLQPISGGWRRNKTPSKGGKNVSGRVPSGGGILEWRRRYLSSNLPLPSCQLLLHTRVVSLVYGKHKRYTIVFYRIKKGQPTPF